MALTDRVTIMRDSQVVGTWDTEVSVKDEIISKMIGRDITSAFPPKTAAICKGGLIDLRTQQREGS